MARTNPKSEEILLNTTKTQDEQDQAVIDPDGLFWAIDIREDVTETYMSFVKSKDATQPIKHECGHKYNIVSWESTSIENAEIYSAVLGDPEGYVLRQGAAGYNGCMIKNDLGGANTNIYKVLKKFLSGVGFKPRMVKILLNHMKGTK